MVITKIVYAKFIPIKSDEPNNFFVTWKCKDDRILKRYYHLFSELEIKQLLAQLSGIKIINKSFEQDNWCIILEKI